MQDGTWWRSPDVAQDGGVKPPLQVRFEIEMNRKERQAV
jgi:hypothetical protein